MLAPSPATAIQAALKGAVRSARSSSQAIEDNQLNTKTLLFMNILIIEITKLSINKQQYQICNATYLRQTVD